MALPSFLASHQPRNGAARSRLPVEQDRSGTATQRFARFIGAGEGAQGPEAEFALPHVLQFSGIIGGAWRTYYHGQYDEAMRFSQEDALAMRNDAWLMSLLNERKRAVATLKQHIEVDNPRDPVQKALADGLTQIYKNLPRQTDLAWSGLEAIWFGRSGDQFVWRYKNVQVPAMPRMAAAPGVPASMVASEGEFETRRVLCLQNHLPIEGDKIDYDFEGTPYILVSPIVALNTYRSAGADLRTFGKDGKWHSEQDPPEPMVPDLNAKHASLGFTTIGGKALFLKGNWRSRFRIHTHEAIDSSYWQPWKAGSLHGVGIRSVIFWYWWLRQEYLANVTDWAARAGLGIKLWYYEQGNAKSKQNILQAARESTQQVNIAVPYDPTQPNRPAVDIVEMAGTGADLLLTIVKHVEEYIERYVVGQNMTGGSDDFSAGFGDKGRADLASSTQWQITKLDALKFADTNTTDILDVIKRYSYPEYAEIPARIIPDVDDPDIKGWSEGAKTFVEFGGEIPEDDARSKLGISKPRLGEKTLGGAAALQAQQATSGHVPPPGGQPGANGKTGANGQPGQEPSPLEHAADTADNLRMQGDRPESYGWVTIGGHEEGDAKHVGGFHVEIDKDGKVIRGGAGVMHGKPLHEAVHALNELGNKEKSSKEPEKPQEPEKPKEAELSQPTGSAKSSGVVQHDPAKITTLNRPREKTLKTLIERMKKEGWQGSPILAVRDGEKLSAITGSNRTEAARQLGISVPVKEISADDWAKAATAAGWSFTPNPGSGGAIGNKERLAILDKMEDKSAAEIMRGEPGGLSESDPEHWTNQSDSSAISQQPAPQSEAAQPKSLSPQEQDKLIVDNFSLVRQLSGQMAGKFGYHQDDLESPAQEALVKAARNYDPDDGDFKAYASVVMRNAMRDAMRKEMKTKGALKGGAQSLATKEGQNIDVEARREGVTSGPQMAEVDEAIATLPEESRRILEERKQGRQFKDIAELLGMNISTVKARMRTASELVRSMVPHAFDSIAHWFDEKWRYEYGPRHHPEASVKGAVLRLRALKEHHIDGEVLDAELDSIAREFTADELRQIAEQCEVKAAGTKWETLANLREYVEARVRHSDPDGVERYEEEVLYKQYRAMIEGLL